MSVIPPRVIPEVTFCQYFIGVKNHVLEEEVRLIFNEHVAVHRGSCFIFTDGSKSNADVGFGVYGSDFCYKVSLPAESSIFTAELYTILKAIEKVATMEDGYYTIFCDSRSVLQALGNFNPDNPLVLRVLQWLHIILY